jgi:predicted DNA-binding protein (MmcQ/YjbR family)
VTTDGTKPKPDIARAEAAIAARAAAFPETTEDQPWGHRAFKVKGKTFLFLATEAGGLSISLKLPESGVLALELPFTEPTGYGLGKSGWVSARFSSGKDVPLSLIAEWLDESYRAIAPKKLTASLASPAPASKAASKPKKPPASVTSSRAASKATSKPEKPRPSVTSSRGASKATSKAPMKRSKTEPRTKPKAKWAMPRAKAGR